MKGNAMAIACLVMGIIAFVLGWIPLLGLIALPVALLGLVFGACALTACCLGRRPHAGTAVLGVLLSLAGGVIALAVTGSLAVRMSDAAERRQAETKARLEAIRERPRP